MSRLPKSIASTLESAPPPVIFQSTSVLASVEEPAKKPEAETSKKVRTKRVPNGIIPGVSPSPDPERWLKKSERTTYAQGKKRRGGGGGATQGATVGAESAPVSTASQGRTGGKGKGGKKK